MKLDDLRPAPGARRKRRRVGRGPASGRGKTAGKGHKGHKARSGGGKGGGFEGGQMPLYRRLPKRGFLPHGGKRRYAVVNLDGLAAFPAGTVVDPDRLVEAGLIKRGDRSQVKILADGELTQALTVRAHAVSAAARTRIEGAGGRVELLAGKAAGS